MTFGIGTPFTRGAGYLLNNQGLNVSQREEADIRTCTHCQAVIRMQAWRDNGAFCGKCMAPICAACGTRAMTYGCEPFLKKIEQYAEQQMRFAKILKDAGPTEPVPPQPIITGSR
jgi:hypothetical protein